MRFLITAARQERRRARERASRRQRDASNILAGLPVNDSRAEPLGTAVLHPLLASSGGFMRSSRLRVRGLGEVALREATALDGGNELGAPLGGRPARSRVGTLSATRLHLNRKHERLAMAERPVASTV